MDRSLLDAADQAIAGQGDGRISKADASNLLARIYDGGNITSTEQNTILYILRNYNFTDAARNLFLSRLGGITPPTTDDPPNDDNEEPSDPPPTIAEIISQVIRVEYQLYRMQVDIPEEGVRSQVRDFPGSNTFEEALRDGLASFLEDPTHPESPRRMIFNLYAQDFRFITDEQELEDAVTAKLKEAMNEGIFRIWLRQPEGAEDPSDFSPPGGESISEYWIWEMFLPRVSDHGYYAILDRGNQRPTYNYGFN